MHAGAVPRCSPASRGVGVRGRFGVNDLNRDALLPPLRTGGREAPSTRDGEDHAAAIRLCGNAQGRGRPGSTPCSGNTRAWSCRARRRPCSSRTTMTGGSAGTRPCSRAAGRTAWRARFAPCIFHIPAPWSASAAICPGCGCCSCCASPCRRSPPFIASGWPGATATSPWTNSSSPSRAFWTTCATPPGWRAVASCSGRRGWACFSSTTSRPIPKAF